MAKVPENCPKEFTPHIKSGLELVDLVVHNAVAPFGGEPEHRFHTASLKPSRRVRVWITPIGYIFEQKGKWRVMPEANGKLSEPLIEAPSIA